MFWFNIGLITCNIGLQDDPVSILGFFLNKNLIFVMQIKREISIMKLVRHPYVVRLHEVCDIFNLSCKNFLQIVSFVVTDFMMLFSVGSS